LVIVVVTQPDLGLIDRATGSLALLRPCSYRQQLSILKKMALLDDGDGARGIPVTGQNQLVELWGGAFSVRMPAGFLDASDLRPIPDNQEVFVHQDTDQSIIFELLESVAAEDALSMGRAHVHSILNDNEALADQHHRIISATALNSSHFPELQVDPAEMIACFVHAEMLVSKFKEQARNRIGLYVLVVRLQRVNTDVLVVYHHPLHISPDSSSAELDLPAGNAEELFIGMVKTLALHDWDIFG
jgi:hypothetical protein